MDLEEVAQDRGQWWWTW